MIHKRLLLCITFIGTMHYVHASAPASTPKSTSTKKTAGASSAKKQSPTIPRVSPRTQTKAKSCVPPKSPTFAQEHRALLSILKNHAITLEEKIEKLKKLQAKTTWQEVDDSIEKWIGNLRLRIKAQQEKAAAQDNC